MTSPTLVERYEAVRLRVERACEAAGRSSDEVTLLAVSKTKPIEDIEAVFAVGHKEFGENYVQEWQEKEALRDPHMPGFEWHFIGHLQRNKCKYVAGKVALVHSVHSASLLRELEKRTPEGQTQPVLLQFNVGQEESKSGFGSLEEVAPLFAPEQPWQRVEIKGLMSLPPYMEDPEATRPSHRKLRELRDKLEEVYQISLPHLSMGMSHDLEVAIQEGATFVRVGTAIFGPRG